MRNFVSYRLTSHVLFVCAFLLLFAPYRSDQLLFAVFPALVFFSSFIAVRFASALPRAALGLVPALALLIPHSGGLYTLAAVLLLSAYCAAVLGMGNFGFEIWQYRPELGALLAIAFLYFLASFFLELSYPTPIFMMAASVIFGFLAIRAMRSGSALSRGWQAGSAGFFLAALAGLVAVGVLLWAMIPLYKLLAHAVAWIWGGLMVLIVKLFTLLMGIADPIEEDLPELTPEPSEDVFEPLSPGSSSASHNYSVDGQGINIDWRIVLAAIGVILAVVAVILLVRSIGRRGKRQYSAEIKFEDYPRSDDDGRRGKRRRGRRRATNAEKIRAVYRSYLSFLSRNGIRRRCASTTQDISDEANEILIETDELLRVVYRRARYGLDEITDEDVAAAEEAYLRLVNDRNLKKPV